MMPPACLVGIIDVSTDITERRQVEEALHESAGRSRLLVDGARDYAMFLMDTDGDIVHWNTGAERLTGYDESEALGRSADIIFTPEDRAAGVPEHEMRRAAGQGRADDKRWHVRKDGTRFWADGVMTALYHDDGQLRGFAKVMRDATREQQVDDALRESEARKTAILKTALDCIITIDGEGKVIEWNPAAENTFGYSRATAIGQSMSTLLVPESLRKQHNQGEERYVATRESTVLGKRLELAAVRADGSEILIEVSSTAIPIDGPPLFTAYLCDITERKRNQEAWLVSSIKFS